MRYRNGIRREYCTPTTFFIVGGIGSSRIAGSVCIGVNCKETEISSIKCWLSLNIKPVTFPATTHFLFKSPVEERVFCCSSVKIISNPFIFFSRIDKQTALILQYLFIERRKKGLFHERIDSLLLLVKFCLLQAFRVERKSWQERSKRESSVKSRLRMGVFCSLMALFFEGTAALSGAAELKNGFSLSSPNQCCHSCVPNVDSCLW